MSARPRPQQDEVLGTFGDEPDQLDPASVDRINRNLSLLSEFLQAVFDDPSILDESPEHSNLIFIPEDDPELAKVNLQGAERMARAGHSVHVHYQRDWKR
ncbi:MAG: DUF5647 family protein [Thermomicrobiales bacterium]